MTISKKTITIGGQELTFETGKIARQAGGAVWLQVDDTVVFGTACMSPEPKEDIDFLPLRVDYQEKFSSAGKTLGGFIKREGRPTERETLVCRLIDRPIRPMFEKGFYHDTQLLAYVWSYDGVHKTDVLAICAASAALVISEIPLIKPIGAVRVGRIDGQFVINPTIEQLPKSDLDLILAGTEDAILMIEGYCDFLTEEEVLSAIETGHESIKVICHALAEWQKEIGKPKNRAGLRPIPEATHKAIAAAAEAQLTEAMALTGKKKRSEAIDAIRTEVIDALCPDGSKHTALNVKMAFKKLQSRVMRRRTVDSQVRPDGRSPTDIRQISVEQGILPSHPRKLPLHTGRDASRSRLHPWW